jgi:hypothetical protein
MYFGNFHGGTYYEGTRHFLGYANLAYPEKPILDTEFGYWSGELNSPSGQESQNTVFTETFPAFTFRASVIRPDGTYRDGGYLMGVTWWCIFDWYSHQHSGGFQSMGLYRMNRDTLKLVGTTLKNAYAPFYNIGGMVTDINEEDNQSIPDDYTLGQNFPNPFNPETKIRYSIPNESFVKVKIYDALGSEVATVVNENKIAGKYEMSFDANKYRLSSGIYFYRLQAGNYVETKKMTLIK